MLTNLTVEIRLDEVGDKSHFVITDNDTDNRDLLAIVDPNGTIEDLLSDDSVARFADLLASAPTLDRENALLKAQVAGFTQTITDVSYLLQQVTSHHDFDEVDKDSVSAMQSAMNDVERARRRIRQVVCILQGSIRTEGKGHPYNAQLAGLGQIDYLLTQIAHSTPSPQQREAQLIVTALYTGLRAMSHLEPAALAAPAVGS